MFAGKICKSSPKTPGIQSFETSSQKNEKMLYIVSKNTLFKTLKTAFSKSISTIAF